MHKNYLAAGYAETTVKTLRLLSVSDIAAVRRRVAENPKTPADILTKMAVDKDSQVRIAVGLNSATPHVVLSRLVYDDDPDVRYWLASTSYLPVRILMELTADKNPYVSQRAERTVFLMEAGLSQRTLTIFQFLEQDHSLLVSRLEKLIEHYSSASQHYIFDETVDAFDELGRHFGRQHKLCLDEISNANKLSGELLGKCAADHMQINEKIETLILMHVEGKPDFCRELGQLLELVVKHIEFAEKELFVELRRHVTPQQMNEMNERLNQALLLSTAS
jgi:hypothetical protein